MPGPASRPATGSNHIFNGQVNLREFENVSLAGAHLHFNGAFDLRDLMCVDLRHTTIIINDYHALPPCSCCGNSLVQNGIQTQTYRQTAIPPTPDTNMSMNEPQEPLPCLPETRPRGRAPSEDGELRSSSPGASTKPLAPEIHPERMAMLRGPTPEASPSPIKPQTKTKANCLAMPFNRLEERQQHTFNPGFSVSADEERVDSFLQSLEPAVPAPALSSELFGRLSPESEMEFFMSPARRQLQDELETYGVRGDVWCRQRSCDRNSD